MSRLENPILLASLFLFWAATLFTYFLVLLIPSHREGFTTRLPLLRSISARGRMIIIYAIGWCLILCPILFIWWIKGAKL